ncbi:MAG: hypothetical protein A4S09_02110 [Proteobacteria bacterium SG_bin7]|nr:MAG: hypothetical protein A4S09_02110 [Proteobacteria bacterium SG_bin7]
MSYLRNVTLGLIISLSLCTTATATVSCDKLFSHESSQFSKSILYKIFSWGLDSRYDVTVKGLEEVKARGTKGTLFLLTHESYSDPVIAQKVLEPHFHPRPVMDEGQTQIPYVGKLIKWAAENVNVLLVPRVKRDSDEPASASVDRLVNEISKALARGENIFLYPSGHIRLGQREIIADSASGPGKAVVHMILQKYPEARIVLGRYQGFDGSSLGNTGYHRLKTSKGGLSALWNILNAMTWGTFGLAPKRDITLEFWEPENFPRQGSRQEINLFIEKYFNEIERTRRYIPYSYLQSKIHGKEIILPPIEDVDLNMTEAEQHGPFQVRPENKAKADDIIVEIIEKVNGQGSINKENLKSKDDLIDLGVDSLRFMELTVALEETFGVKIDNPSLLKTVEDVYWCAEGNDLREATKVKASRQWNETLTAKDETFLNFPKGDTLLQMTVNQSANSPHKVIGEDAMIGALTNRNRLLKAFVLAKVLKRQIDDEYVGLMMPPSVGGRTIRLSLMRAGKIPAMVNYTDGVEGIKNAMDLVGAKKIVTSKTFVERLKARDPKKIGLDPLIDRFIFVEDLKSMISLNDKIWGSAESLIYAGLRSFRSTSKYVAVLFTSGSTAAPKGVPVTDKMIAAVIKLLKDNLPLTNKDSILAVAPTFHSLGFALEAASDVLGIPLYHFPDPTNGAGMAKVVGAYKTTYFVGTPDFIMNLYKSGTPEQLKSLRYVISGAAKLTQDVVDIVKEKTPDAVIVEGYGVTEAVPLIAINPYKKPKQGSVGKMVVDHVVVNPETLEPVTGSNQEGILLVKGDNIMSGYFNQTEAQNPFVDAKRSTDSKIVERWYNTEDIVRIDDDGYVFIVGRMGRFRKKGGEKIALPRIEETLVDWVSSKARALNADVNGPLFAVESAGDNSPFVLFTAFSLGANSAEILNQVNNELAARGLPSSHNIQEVRYLPEGIPMLGSGKPRPKALQELLKKEKM